MHWLLTGILACMVLVIYRFEGKKILVPSFISVVVFFISSFIFSLNAERWQINLTLETIAIIISGLVVFFLGGRAKISRHSQKKIICDNTYSHYCVPKKNIFLLFAFNCLAVFCIYRRVLQISAISVLDSEYMLRNVRATLATDIASWGIIISILRESMYSIGYICLSVFLINVIPSIKQNLVKNMYLLLPVLPMLIGMYFSTGRTGFIRVFGVSFVIGMTIFTYHKRIRLSKFVKIGVASFVCLLFVFFQVGKATGKSQIFSAFDTLSIYIGSSIGALNEYLKTPTSYSDSFAGETLYGVRNIVRFFYENIKDTPVVLPFTYVVNGHNTNVYTAFRRYINDFGIVGLYIVQFFKGCIFGNWARTINKTKAIGLSLILYAYFMYDIFMQSIEENLLREFLTTAQIFSLVVFWCVFTYLIKPYRKRR